MIKVAFIKFGGMANGGTEKVLQTIASELTSIVFCGFVFSHGSLIFLEQDVINITTNIQNIVLLSINVT